MIARQTVIESDDRERIIEPVLVLQQFQEAWPGWYHNPGRWPTSDGIIPFKLFEVCYRAVKPRRALDRINLSKAINLAFAGEENGGTALIERELDEAYPEG